MTEMQSRRHWMVQQGIFGAACALGMGGLEQAKGQSPSKNESGVSLDRKDVDSNFTEQAEAAIQKGLDYLRTRWSPDGGFLSQRGGQNVAINGLAGIAFLGRGIRPSDSGAGELLGKISRFVLDCCTESGFIEAKQKVTQPTMYEHGFATLFLAELHGVSPRYRVREPLQRAVDLIVRTQNNQGGWRYNPEPKDADLSVTVCQVMALRAARNAGIAVPVETIDRALDYIKRSQNGDGGFMYQLTGGASRFPITSAAIVAMYNSGIASGQPLEQAFDYLQRNVGTSLNSQNDTYFYYAHYYSAQAFWHRGGDAWPTWYQRLRDLLLPLQQPDGSWFDFHSAEYGTAMACIILNLPRSVLPIFQR